MNKKEKLEEIIKDLLYLQQEGEYWDFKEKWHDNNACLLHDIICMANNLTEKDSYIIIGVQDKTFSIKNIENDVNRKNTQNVVDFLKDKKFAGGIRPTVYVETLSNGLDVIVIANSNNVPFYLTENYNVGKEVVRANHIYTRIQDTNIPKDKSADMDKVSLLWKRRFGIDKTPLEQFSIYIENKDDWKYCSGYYEKYFYKFNPIFVICEILPQVEIRDQVLDGLKNIVKEEISDGESSREEWFTAIQVSANLPSWHELNFLYNQTKIYSITTVNIDGGRCHMPAPFFDYSFLGDPRIDNTKENYRYSYFIENSIEYKMINFLSEKFDSYEHAFNTAMENVLVFESDDERKQFNDYIIYDIGLERFKNKFDEQKSTAYSRKSKGKQFGDQTDEWLKIDHKSAKTNKYFFNEFKNKGVL